MFKKSSFIEDSKPFTVTVSKSLIFGMFQSIWGLTPLIYQDCLCKESTHVMVNFMRFVHSVCTGFIWHRLVLHCTCLEHITYNKVVMMSWHLK